MTPGGGSDAEFFEFLARDLEFVLHRRQVGDGHIVAVLGEPQGDGFPDASSGAGDVCNGHDVSLL